MDGTVTSARTIFRSGWRRWLPMTLNLALIAIGCVIYFFRLRTVPAGYFQDTGATLLNAACLLANGTDEYGVRYPYLGLRSFGEGKAPAFTFVLSALGHFSKLRPFLARELSAGMGFAAVVLMFGFGLATRAVPRPRRPWVIGATWCLCLTSPWILVLHRFPTEPTMTDVLVIANIATAYLLLKTGKLSFALLNGLFVGLGGYVYHALKVLFILHPLVVGASTWCQRRAGRRATIKAALVSVGVSLLVAAPLIHDAVSGDETMRRIRTGGILEDSWLTRITRYFVHFDFNFLFVRGGSNPVEHSGFLGELSLGLLPFLAWGIVLACRRVRRGNGFWVYVLMMAVLGFAPAALGPGHPPEAQVFHAGAATMPIMLLAVLGATTFDRYAAMPQTRFSWPFRVVAGAFALLSTVTFVYGAIWYLGPAYAEWSKASWRPTADIRRELTNGNKNVPVTDHGVGSVYERTSNVLHGDLRYCR